MSIPDPVMTSLEEGLPWRSAVTASLWLLNHRSLWPELWPMLDFDLGYYLPPKTYDYYQLYAAYERASNDGVGMWFTMKLAQWEAEGKAFAPHFDNDGVDFDFLSAVIAVNRHPRDGSPIVPVQGRLVVTE